jgi:hypothetical protein
MLMRFGVLGPANGDLAALEEGASLLLFEYKAEEVIYLGPDDALDRLVLEWVGRLVGTDPSQDGIWERAARHCSSARHEEIDRFVAAERKRERRHEEIDRFVAAERKRERLKALKCLPAATARTVEILEGRIAVFLYDKALLDEEDILPATLLVFGKSSEAIVRQVGTRTFISPGDLVNGKSGVTLFSDDPNGDLNVSLFEPGGTLLESHLVSASRTGRFRVLDKASPGEPT